MEEHWGYSSHPSRRVHDRLQMKQKLVQLLSRSRTVFAALLGQASSSLSSLLVSAWLLLAAAKESFGLYSLCFSIALVAAGMISSGLTVQFVVNLPSRNTPEREIELLSLIYIIVAATLGAAAICATAAPALSIINWQLDVPAVLITASMACAMSCRELVVRYLVFAEANTKVTASSAVLLLTTILLIVLAPTSVSKVVWAGFTYSAATVVSLLACRPTKLAYAAQVSPSTLIHTLRDSWSGGKWGILSNIFFSARNQAHSLILAPLGMSTIADVNAARLLFMPIFQIIPVISQVGLSTTSKRREESKQSAIESGNKVVVISVVPLLLYGVTILIASLVVPEHWIPSDYRGALPYLAGWGLITCAIGARAAFSTTLLALHEFRAIASGNGLSLAIMALSWLALSNLAGPPAALYSMAAAEIFVAFTYARRLNSIRKSMDLSKHTGAQ